MRFSLAAAAVALAAGSSASAAVVDLTYDLNLVLTEYRSFGDPLLAPTPPELGETKSVSFSFPVDTEESSGVIKEFFDGTGTSYSDFDPETGSISYDNVPNIDTQISFELLDDGIGTYFETRPFFSSPLKFFNASYDVTSWTVEGLSGIAPVPLPPSMPLLAAGLGIGSLVVRRARKRA